MKGIAARVLALLLSATMLKGYSQPMPTSAPAPEFTPPPKLTEQQIHALSILGKVWGLLKYYHPHVASGETNWDSVLIAKIPLFIASPNSNTVNHLLQQWLSDLGPVDTCRTCGDSQPNTRPDSLKATLQLTADTTWLHKSALDPSLIRQLDWIIHNRYQGPGYYIDYAHSHQIKITNEKGYQSPEYLYPTAAYRLLFLFRYWNIANYFSPYVYLTDKPWPKVMDEFIPLFYEAKDTLAYHLLMMRLLSSLGDGHTGFTPSPQLWRYFGDYAYEPFECMFIDGKAVVARLYNDSLCRLAGIKKGDVIVKVDGESVAQRLKRCYPYVYGASNEAAKRFLFSESMLFAGGDSVMDIEISNQQGRQHKRIRRYKHTALFFTQTSPARKPPFHILQHRIMYVDMGQLTIADVDSLKKAAATCKAIIFDLRDNSNDTWMPIATWLADKPFDLGKISYRETGHPGYFRFERAGPFPGSATATAGTSTATSNNTSKDTPTFQGKVAILVNEGTKSHGEYTAMGLQAAAKTKILTIGSQTAGADGDITSWILLPGGFRTRFSSLGIYYPDGTTTQRKGVKVDIIIRPSIKGLQEGKDEVLDKAIHVLDTFTIS